MLSNDITGCYLEKRLTYPILRDLIFFVERLCFKFVIQSMADLVELRASVNSIKRVDPYVKDILLTATQVALYQFNISKRQWVKSDKEGALFLYSRNGEPYHSIMILNRLNKENFIEPIIREFDYQMQLPFLLYRNYKSKIYGIWFFNRDECIQAGELIKSLMEKDSLDERFSRGLDRRQNGVSFRIFISLTQIKKERLH